MGRFRETVQPAPVEEIGRSWVTVGGTPVGNPTIYYTTLSQYRVKRTWDEKHPGPPYKTGGPFRSIEGVNPRGYVQGKGYYVSNPAWQQPYQVGYHYQGGFVPTGIWRGDMTDSNIANVGLSGVFGPDYGDPSDKGAEAWNRFKPKLRFADGAVFLAELRELPGQLKTTAEGFHKAWKEIGGQRGAFMNPRNVADQFLNLQFGWLPFINDIRKFTDLADKYDKRLKQMARDNNRWIRRRGTMEKSKARSEQQLITTPQVYPALPTQLYKAKGGKYGFTQLSRETSTDCWFSGAFKYYIPSLDDPTDQLSKVRNFLQLYGLQINPTLLWEITPWSWLVDWVSNVGDVVDNATSTLFDNMAAKYAYLMQHTTDGYINDTTIFLQSGDVHCSWSCGVDCKIRVAADPFGFDLGWDDFSPRQLAILAALGITRGAFTGRQ